MRFPLSFGDAQVVEVVVLGDVRENDARATLLGGEPLDGRPQRLLEDVVGQEHAAPVAADEALREPERFGDPARFVLVGVEETVDPVLLAVAQQPKELARVGAAGDEHQLGEPRLDERFDCIRHHRPVVQRQQVLVRDPRERSEPTA